MYKIPHDKIPKVAKDFPWFIMRHPKLSIDNMDHLLLQKGILRDILTYTNAEPEAFQLLDWVTEHSNVIGLNVKGLSAYSRFNYDEFEAFNIYIDVRKLSDEYHSAEHFMSDTMPTELKEAFIKNHVIQL